MIWNLTLIETLRIRGYSKSHIPIFTMHMIHWELSDGQRCHVLDIWLCHQEGIKHMVIYAAIRVKYNVPKTNNETRGLTLTLYVIFITNPCETKLQNAFYKMMQQLDNWL